MIVCNTDCFSELTKGGEYEILDVDTKGECVVVKNNAGKRRAYHSSWFF